MQKFKEAIAEKMNGAEILCLVVILLTAAFLRFYGLPHIEFKSDEALNLLMGIDLVEGRKFPLVGLLSSVGTETPATFIYLISLPLIFTRNPVYVSGFIALISVAAVYGCFLLARSMFNKRVGLISSALFAVNPWVLLYSRKIWHQDFLPFFTVGFFYSLYKGAIEEKYGYLLLASCFLALITQIHMSTIGFICIFLYILWSYKHKIPSKYFAASAALFGLLYVPYLIYDIQHNFINIKILLNKGLQGLTFFPEALTIPFSLSTAVNFLEGTYIPKVDYVVVTFMVVSLIFVLANWKDVRYKLLACWFLIPMFFLATGRTAMYWDTPYSRFYYNYYIQYYPLIFLVTAIGIDALLTSADRQSRKKGGFIIYSILLAVLVYFTTVSCRFDYMLGKSNNILWMGYGTPFSTRVEEIKEIMEQERAKGSPAIDAGRVQFILNREGKTYKYDFDATYYIVKYLDRLS